MFHWYFIGIFHDQYHFKRRMKKLKKKKKINIRVNFIHIHIYNIKLNNRIKKGDKSVKREKKGRCRERQWKNAFKDYLQWNR